MVFARELRELRERAGNPKFETMARRTGRSKSTLAGAVGGQHLPRWETVDDFVRACDADPRPWRARWLALRVELGAPPPSCDTDDTPTALDETDPPTPSGEAPSAPDDPEDAPPVRREPVANGDTGPGEPSTGMATPPRWTRTISRGRPRRLVAAAVALGLALVGGGYLLGRADTHPTPSASSVEAIQVQNKVALGSNYLVEDKTPEYLSALPIAYCAAPDRSCKIPGTEMASGAAVVANCVTHGQQMWNYNLADPAVASNPDRAASDLWYRASFPDGRSGYVSEVYLVAGSRGGLGLPNCGPSVPIAAPQAGSR